MFILACDGSEVKEDFVMNEAQKLAYEATLQRLREAFPDDPAPSIRQASRYLRCDRYSLTKHKSFRSLTFGDTHKRITLENLALWQCKIIT